MKYWTALVVSVILAVVVPVGFASADVNNFKIVSYDIEYYLSRGEDGASQLRTVETITAQFPETDQNRGLERAIPVKYDNRKLPLEIIAVSNEVGQELQTSYSDSGEFKILRIGDPDKYVHGLHTYRIEYSQRHVTQFFQDTNATEWYWDTNGTGWRVPIESLSVTVNVSEDLIDDIKGSSQCYIGVLKSGIHCDISEVTPGKYNVPSVPLGIGENVTLAIAFEKETFANYSKEPLERLIEGWLIVTVITSVIGIVVIIRLSMAYHRRSERSKELKPIPVEFLPPKDFSVTVSARVSQAKVRGSTFVPQLIDFAVRRYIQIVEAGPRSFWRPAKYDIVISKDVSLLKSEELEIISDMFGYVPAVGDRLSLSSLISNYAYASTLDDDKKLDALLVGQYNLREKKQADSDYFRKWSIWLLVFGVLLLAPVLLIGGLILIFSSMTIKPLTDKGLSLKRYLLGFREYIKLAEVDRLNFLQGPDTAEKVAESIDVKDSGQILKLYERTLPYAILYGYEKEWTKRLGELYESSSGAPDWYSGKSAFNATAFVSALNSFSESVSYSSSAASSSSSGGSGGGGFSGGGGGGGGGGGW